LIGELERKYSLEPNISKQIKQLIKKLLQVELADSLLQKASVFESKFLDDNSLVSLENALELTCKSVDVQKQGAISATSVRLSLFMLDRLGNAVMTQLRSNIIQVVTE